MKRLVVSTTETPNGHGVIEEAWSASFATTNCPSTYLCARIAESELVTVAGDIECDSLTELHCHVGMQALCIQHL